MTTEASLFPFFPSHSLFLNVVDHFATLHQPHDIGLCSKITIDPFTCRLRIFSIMHNFMGAKTAERDCIHYKVIKGHDDIMPK